MRIAIVTLYTPEIANYAELTSQNKLEYANKYGYDFIEYKETLDPTRPASWSKIQALLRNMDNYDWLFWTDADSIITNMEIPLTKWIDDGYKIIWCQDIDTQYSNCGQMLVKCCRSNKDFLELVWKQEHLINITHWEQGVIRFLLDANYPLKHKLLEAREFNSFDPASNNHGAEIKNVEDEIFKRRLTFVERRRKQNKIKGLNKNNSWNWEIGDFICHYPGVYDDKRYELIKRYLDETKLH